MSGAVKWPVLLYGGWWMLSRMPAGYGTCDGGHRDVGLTHT